ncbi:MAG: PqqD family protein [Pseudomonadota bacterium]|nr:PqqD family protein [Pseudomonadota bacterium]
MNIQRRSLFKVAAGVALGVVGLSFSRNDTGIPRDLWREMRHGLWMHAAPTRNPDIVSENIGGETILHSRSQGAAILKLNATAGFIWARCDGRRDFQAIVRDVSGRFDVAPARCGRDVLMAVLNMRRRGLLL